jgi:hypothetical protein
MLLDSLVKLMKIGFDPLFFIFMLLCVGVPLLEKGEKK